MIDPVQTLVVIVLYFQFPFGSISSLFLLALLWYWQMGPRKYLYKIISDARKAKESLQCTWNFRKFWQFVVRIYIKGNVTECHSKFPGSRSFMHRNVYNKRATLVKRSFTVEKLNFFQLFESSIVRHGSFSCCHSV